jgi:nucleotide-binding universal stress UspA family protein/mannitol/fructose-specific phosphotransferase system IIA component (Ntr-type)
MLVNVRVLDTPRAWAVPLVLAAGVVATKGAAAWITGAVYGWSREERTVAFGLSVPHAAGTLAIVLVGFELGLFDQAEVNGTVVMILVTCLAGPWLVERAGRTVALHETRKPYDPAGAPRRILVPLANPATADRLLDLALLLRGDSHEPLHPLMVADDADAPEAAVAEAERMLSHAVLHAAAAEVPVVPLTRVDRNVAAGIARGAAESRASLLVVGWDGTRSGSSFLFGSVLDQLLDETRQAVLVARLTHPVQTTRRVTLVVPPGAASHGGFAEALRLAAELASRAGAAVRGVAAAAERGAVEAEWARVRPQPAAAWEGAARWAELASRLGADPAEDELVLLLGARRGTVHWSPRLERLPALLAGHPARAFAVLYPPERGEGEGDGDAAAPASPGEADPDAVVPLDGARWETALGRLAGAVLADPEGARALTERLVTAEGIASSEVAPGIVLPHVRVAGVRRAVLAMGVAPAGIAFPHATAPVRLVFLLVSPLERPEEHLRQLARIARLAASRERLGALLGRAAPGTSTDWMHEPR